MGPVQGLIRHFRPELEARFAEFHAKKEAGRLLIEIMEMYSQLETKAYILTRNNVYEQVAFIEKSYNLSILRNIYEIKNSVNNAEQLVIVCRIILIMTYMNIMIVEKY